MDIKLVESKKVLYVENDSDIRELYALKFESEFGLEVIEAISTGDAIDKLKNKSFHSVISDFNMPGGNGDVLYHHVREHLPSIPFLFLTTEDIISHENLKDFFENNSLNTHLLKPLDDNKFKMAYDRIFSKENSRPVEVNSSGYLSINIERLYKFKEIAADLFVKLSEDKFVRILSKDEGLDNMFLDKYKNRGVKFIYLEQAEYYRFVKKMSDALMARLKDNTLTSDARVRTELDVYQHIRESLRSVGLNDQSIEMAQTAFESSLKVFRQTKNIFSLLNQVLSRKDDFVEHSIMASYFCYFIAQHMSWPTPQILAKFNFAAIFHDYDLLDKKLARINDIQSDDFENLTSGEKKNLLEHPMKASSIVISLPCVPRNVDVIIMQHHEKPDGTGFPKQLTATGIYPMSAVFILAHYMTHFFFVNGFTTENSRRCLDYLKIYYDKGTFKIPLQGLLKAFPK